MEAAYISPMAATMQAYRTRLLLELALEEGLTLADCLSKTSLRASDLELSELVFSMEDQIRIIANVGRELPDCDIGLQMGCRIGLFSRDRVGIWLASMSTLNDIVVTAERYQDLLQSPMKGYVTNDGIVARLDFEYSTPVDANGPAVRLHTECIAASMVTTIAQIIGRPLDLIECQFAHETPSYQHQYGDVFNASVSFGHDHSRLIFSATELSARSLFCQQVSTKEYESAAENEYRELQKTRGVIDQVRQQLHLLPNNKSDLNQVATQLGLSPRTLRRRLNDKGVSFRSLREAYLLKKAEELLTGSGLNIEAVAMHLGYSDASNFRRALRRWKGQSPAEVRRSASTH
ncbi:hypothetical protein A9Q99_19100 [Gammaproteobacteria bacterium 45_16_T64]|nr:hypothetical protein A9Q99_19100 [Gammaproteobacteria bacterium 45_16_T64]